MKYILAQKAYQVNFDKINEGFLSSGNICYAESRNKAKSILFNEIGDEGWELRYSDDPLSYINIPVIRAPEYDKFIF